MGGCRGGCMVARGWGACVVAGGHAWLPGGMRGCWGACMVTWGGFMVAGVGGCAWLPGGMHDIRQDTVNERAVHILTGMHSCFCFNS